MKHVCAWCHYEYISAGRLRKLSDKEYAKVDSHGVCPLCSEEMRKQLPRKEKV